MVASHGCFAAKRQPQPSAKLLAKVCTLQIADEGFDGVHQDSVILENLSKDKVLGVISESEAASSGDEVQFEPPPIESMLNLYDLEAVAHATLKASSWGYYSTGSMDEFTKCALHTCVVLLPFLPLSCCQCVCMRS